MGKILDIFTIVVWGIFIIYLVYKFIQSIRMVPTKRAYIVERLGKYTATLGPGFHALIPFLDKVVFIRDLKEETMDVPPQECFTRDNVKVEVDGVTYISVMDPVKACYGITNYRMGAIQLAQTTTRSAIGTLDLDQTFEERDTINLKVVEALSDAGESWGIRVHRFEIKNITPPTSVQDSMEKQVNAERERRAIVARSEGDKQSKINKSDGLKMELINKAKGEMQKRINEAEGKAQEIEAIAEATAESIKKMATVISLPGGKEAIRLQLSENFIHSLDEMATNDTEVILPADMLNVKEMLHNIGL
ncbi:SPFH domain-containing protein [candidate division CSSED10-310 bacterium]|uniref:SPFH domain-containing protein n=1 Tax=candidate division CSSED10-310 bacterium TaxID=2855610 RepID=A0ABV6Z6B0_UNCC1